jgi:hypothetical protein
MTRLAIDVYHGDATTGHYLPNGQIEYVAVDWMATGYPVAIMKASQRLFKDPAFDLQWAAARGLPRIAYHFFEWKTNAIQQAQYLWNVVKNDFGETDYLAVDFENHVNNPVSTNALPALGSMLYELEKFVPKSKLIIYTGTSFWYPCGGKLATWAKAYKHWQAQWPWDNWLLNVIPLPPYVWSKEILDSKVALIDSGYARPVECLPWGRPDIWQFSARMNPKLINGYKSNKKAVDLNYVYTDFGTPVPVKRCAACGQVIP